MASEQFPLQKTEQNAQQIQTIVLEPRDSPPASVATHSESENYHEDSGSVSSSAFARNAYPGQVGRPLWTHRVSASFNAMADQIAAASQAIALIPPLPDTMFGHLQARMDEITNTQKILEGELAEIKEQIQGITGGPDTFKKQLDDHIAEFKLEQQRLPARLHNAMVTVSKATIKPLIMANGKFPSQFPATRGEFEHLTRERYEFLMNSYGLPIAGDLAAKRQAVRIFVGLPA
ncbi:hypothetical protein EW145_g5690 [Phellinidium pouzarii]|uniref:Uncharacterized protein n=1 Tax=Phellinidium pouzarii TaxID=167371 RepID=A0A4S4KZ53_9AGAM|nr:hypothetical protein EW145_g5690 [Phellinidium pouzarii]